jgi:ATP-binding protein involved in chromosome partitioning
MVQSICEGGDNGNPVALNDTATGTAFMKLAAEVVEKTDERNNSGGPTERVVVK